MTFCESIELVTWGQFSLNRARVSAVRRAAEEVCARKSASVAQPLINSGKTGTINAR